MTHLNLFRLEVGMWPRAGSSSSIGRTRTPVALALSKEVSDSRLVDMFVFSLFTEW